MLKFTTVVNYGDNQLQVEADNLRDLHDAVARVEELNREAQYLRQAGATGIVLERHRNGDNEWYGFGDAADPRHCISFGMYRDGDSRTVPFFPRQDGYYRPDDMGPAPTQAPLAQPSAPEASGEAPSERAADVPPPSDGVAPVAGAEGVEQMRAAFQSKSWSQGAARWMLSKRHGVESIAFVPQHKVGAVLRDINNVRLQASAEEQAKRAASQRG
ncbi:MAG: hypothetical protein AAFQ43_00475 [Bacteroidota bacterium]